MSDYYRLLAHALIFVGSLWIIKRGVEGSIRRYERAELHGTKRPLVSASSLPLSLAYIIFGLVAAIMTIASLFQPDSRLLQLVIVVLVGWLMVNIMANWFTRNIP